MINKYIATVFICIVFITNTSAQKIKGRVTDNKQQSIFGITILLKGTNTVTSTDSEGFYSLSNIAPGTYNIVFSGIGYTTKTQSVNLAHGKELTLNVDLEESVAIMDEVVVKGRTQEEKIEEKGFNVDVIQTQKLKSQSLDLNKVLDRSPGIRVRKTGGMGSEYEYSVDGMSGNAIRFFIDGIPMDYFGSSYSINNLPIALIDRVDIYKGVVPVELGSDALGGAINLVTNKNVSNFASASYSFGSFNTHQAALHGQWRAKSGFTTRLSTFYTYSDNNYKVWGDGVFYGEENTARTIYFTKDNPAERFNDDFRTATAKMDIGFVQKKWADQFFITMLVSDQKKGVQTGRTMGHVYGELRNNERVLMPSIVYQKKDLIKEGLDVNVFAGYSDIKATTIDTTTNRYDWRGKIIGYNPSGGEIGRGGSKSLYTLKDKSVVSRANISYELPLNFKLGFNFLYSSTERTGDDPFAEDYEIPFLMPQKIASHFAGISLETVKFDDKLHANVFLKRFGFDSSINELVYTTEDETIVHKNNVANWGGGFAASYVISSKFLIKSSVEQATRLPNATEALGNGVTITSNPFIRPEQSFNVNIGTVLGKYKIGSHQGVKVALNAFYRNVTDILQLNVQGGQEIGAFENIRKIAGVGAEMDIVYDLNQKFKMNLNGTYLNYKNNQKTDENGRDNILYGDRLRNTPYIMANAGIEYNVPNFIQRNSALFAYVQSGYVHEFFLGWPSLGSAANKNVVPSQLTFDAGVGYTFPSRNLVLALDVSNIFNEQVYDNFLLQKPGRAIFLKINYQITQ
ncbi:TonB-dependent receptor [Flavobacterium sp. ST-87]|uniref:TonB-dependent receptor n=1 Tax=Flavobacterium plantiphilum TaxID=3163297 RepID=A0ABW8XS03_9FLAO